MSRGRRPTAARWSGLALLGIIAAASTLPGVVAGTVAADQGWTLAVTPTTVTDGQAVTVTVRTSPGYGINQLRARECRAGVTYQSTAAIFPPADGEANGPNCPGNAISSSSDALVTVDAGALVESGTPAGESFQFRVGTGVQEWTKPGGASASLTCDSGHPCVLLIELSVQHDDKATWQPFTQPLTFQSDDPLAGCNGPADGALQAGGSDRMSDTWINWTLAECQLPNRKGAAARTTFGGEGDAVERFDSGSLDLAYTAGGYDEQMGLAPVDAPAAAGRRAAVPVPVSLNAAVLAVGGGVRKGDHKVPYKDIKLTAAEIAVLLGGGNSPDLPPLYPQIFDRNPELKESGFFDLAAGLTVAGFADPEAFSWYGTRYLTQSGGSSWKVPDVATFGADRGKPRGTDAALALASPSYANALALLTGRPALRKGLIGPSSATAGGVWVLTDLATAKALGLTPVQIENANGQFVGPTAETMAAAVPKMVRDKYGILISDPKATAATGLTQPYPLTFVEYAMAPGEPLLNDECATRDTSQALLKGWLQYVTTTGQAKLSDGMVPLTADLKTEAAKALPKVGASDVTGTCKDAVAKRKAAAAAAPTTTTKPKPTTTLAPPTTTTTTEPAPVADSGSNAGYQSAGGSLSSGPGVATPPAIIPPVPSTVAASAAPATTGPKAPVVPEYAGSAGPAYGGTVVGLIGILGLASLAAVGGTPVGKRWRQSRASDAPPPQPPPGARPPVSR